MLFFLAVTAFFARGLESFVFFFQLILGKPFNHIIRVYFCKMNEKSIVKMEYSNWHLCLCFRCSIHFNVQNEKNQINLN